MHQEHKRLAGVQGFRSVTTKQLQAAAPAEFLTMLYPAGYVANWNSWMKDPRAQQSWEVGNPFFVDLEQNSKHGACTPRPDLPSLLMHGTPVMCTPGVRVVHP